MDASEESTLEGNVALLNADKSKSNYPRSPKVGISVLATSFVRFCAANCDLHCTSSLRKVQKLTRSCSYVHKMKSETKVGRTRAHPGLSSSLGILNHPKTMPDLAKEADDDANIAGGGSAP